MTSGSDKRDPLSVLDRPNSYIGKILPRPNLDRLMQGRGLYVSDIELPRMVHAVFLRSPYAHAKIITIDASAAKHMPGVVAVVTGQELAAVVTPWVTSATEDLIARAPLPVSAASFVATLDSQTVTTFVGQ